MTATTAGLKHSRPRDKYERLVDVHVRRVGVDGTIDGPYDAHTHRVEAAFTASARR